MAESLAAPRARRAYDAPVHPTDPLELPSQIRAIKFLHPGYPYAQAWLLELPAVDAGDTLHYGTALDVCAIIANNRWDGYLTEDNQGVRRVPNDNLNLSLNADKYYFHVPGDPKYPIVPCFAEWQFPHADHSATFPDRWKHNVVTARASPGSSCQLTFATISVEDAHIVPQAVTQWSDHNQMSQYELTDNSNMFRFRRDIHYQFDEKPKFAIVPKYGKLVAHVFNKLSEAHETIRLYHNVPVDLGEQHRSFLLARLAWTIFPLLRPFLTAGVERVLMRRTEQQTYEKRSVNEHECRNLWSKRSRSESPTKKPKRAADTQDEDEYISDSGSDEEYWRQRGRKRRRSSLTHISLYSQSSDGQYVHSGSEASAIAHRSQMDGLEA